MAVPVEVPLIRIDTPGKGVPSELSVTVPVIVCPITLPPIEVSSAIKTISNRFFINGYFGVKQNLNIPSPLASFYTNGEYPLRLFFRLMDRSHITGNENLYKWLKMMIKG
ncbi:hypothetical protein CQA01_38700 [Cyclobacterium qasimii]|uniref:Uncharacterized protein n=1 Tax=Cyclobacterium qasimii TaxID=1350429 RepID=A0A512CGN8_9BACT|nr:hypothetical protein CQA01_38700 [Cyclobacterium qasimii]